MLGQASGSPLAEEEEEHFWDALLKDLFPEEEEKHALGAFLAQLLPEAPPEAAQGECAALR